MRSNHGSSNGLPARAVIAVLAAALGGGCVTEEEPLEEPEVSTTSSAITVLGTYTVRGQSLKVMQLDPISGLTSRITSCGQGVLYASRTDGTLWVNLAAGLGAWEEVTAGTKGTQIACDRHHLFSLDADGLLWHANTGADGQLKPHASGSSAVWSRTVGSTTLSVPTGTTELQGGMGNIYALAFAGGVGTLHSSQLRNPTDTHTQGASWTERADNLGTNLVTGAGSRATYTALVADGLTYRKRNRAFGANVDDTLYYNDTLLYGQNGWSSFPNPGLSITSITADDSNTMFALATNGFFGRRLVRFSFSEANCTDGIDNDASGEADAEDPACRGPLATSWCTTYTSGNYCLDRIQNTNGYSHALVTCKGAGTQPTIKPGLCTKGSFGLDWLTPARANNEPADSGHYCNVHKADGTWDFEWRGSTPCATLAARHPGATVIRAGIYSTTGENSVLVKCTNGQVLEHSSGTTALVNAYNAVGHTANRCVFTASPRQMRIFQSPMITSAWREPLYGGRGYSVGHVFDHVAKCRADDPTGTLACPVPLAQFGNGSTISSQIVDNRGRHVSYTGWDQSNSYDYNINEGTPLKSLGYGTVVSARDRHLASLSTGGTTFQKELYVRYDIGSDPTYAESFIAYYAHLGVLSVVTGQRVAPGQLLGYSGTTGASSGPHLHFGLIRISNTNGKTVAEGDAFGYHVPFAVRTSEEEAIGYIRSAAPGTIDPYGWRAPAGIDPMGYGWARATTGYDDVIGQGAWSPAMFRSSEEPPYE